MSNEKIQELVSKLRDELHATEVDTDTRSMMLQLETDIDDLLNPVHESEDANPVLAVAEQLEARFASDHPTAERVVREIVDMLTKMGV